MANFGPVTIRYFTTIICLYLSTVVLSQDFNKVRICVDEKCRSRSFADSSRMWEEVQEEMDGLWDRGYLAASRSTGLSGDTMTVQIDRGERFEWIKLELEGANGLAFSSQVLKEGIASGRSFSLQEFRTVRLEILDHFQNNGHPFAWIQGENVAISEGGVSMTLRIHPGPRILIRQVVIRTEDKKEIPKKWLLNAIGIQEQEPYSERKLSAIARKLGNLNYLSLVREPEVVFNQEGAEVYLYLKRNRLSRFDGVLGLEPDASEKMSLSGDIKLYLRNLISRGESLDLQWQRTKNLTQRMQAQAAYPYLFQTPLGLAGNFLLFKRDSTSLDLSASAEATYMMNGNLRLSAGYIFKSSNLLSGEQVQVIPGAMAPYRSNGATSGLRWMNFDYIPNPNRGGMITLNGGFSRTQISTDLPEEPTRAQNSITTTLEAQWALSIVPRHVIFMGLNSGVLVSPTPLLNEMFLLGGAGSIRGFNQESLPADLYGIGTVEYRFLLERNSNLFAFFDGGVRHLAQDQEELSEWMLGFGTGIRFSTRVGIFSLSYALGSSPSQRLDLRSGKVHLGFLAYF